MAKFRLLTRRAFVRSLGYTAAAGLLTPLLRGTRAAEGYAAGDAGPGPVREYFLTIGKAGFAPSGKPRQALAVNGSVPGPLLRFREDETAVIHVTNTLDVKTSIHWHGVLVPANMDGVPGVSFPGITPGETFTYTFPVKQYGTYWYHSHSEFQELKGVYGAIVIEQADEPFAYEREHTILFSDWSDEKPERIMANLKKRADYYNWNKRTLGDFIRDAKADGLGPTLEERMAWGKMRMDPTDISDVSGFTFLANGKTPPENLHLPFKPGEKVRLRVINGSAMTYFDLRIPGLRMTVVQTDGQNVEPVEVDEIRLAAAETYDVVVEPEADTYTVFAEAMDRSGFARATLATAEGVEAAIPEMRPRPLRALHEHGSPPAEAAADHAGMDHSAHRMAGGDGHRVLTYADLAPLDNPTPAAPAREIVTRLTGNMERYIWTIDGKRLQEADPIRLTLGERVRFTFVNETMMEHPMHLHGMWMELVGANNLGGARKHTVSVDPGARLSVDVTADAPGAWAFHCHLLFHMMAGMFTTVIISEDGEGRGNADH